MQSNLIRTVQEAGDKQLSSIRITQNNARSCRRRDDVYPVPPLLISQRSSLPDLRFRLLRSLKRSSILRRVRIIDGSTTRRTRPVIRPPPSASASEHIAQGENRALTAVNRK